MVSRQHRHAGRRAAPGAGARGATVLPFPAPRARAGTPPAAPVPAAPVDPLVERLRGGTPALAGRCLSQWADPLDAAILAALLLCRPASGLERRARAASAAGRPAEAAFWRIAAEQLAFITSPAGLPADT